MTEVITENEIIEKVQKEANDEKKWCVYMHTSPSGKRYVGITSQVKPEYRWGQGGCKYLYTNPDGSYKQLRMARAINKYSWDLWKHEILAEILTKNEAKELEKYYIEHYKTQDPKYGYNCTDGGDGVSDKDRTGSNNSNYGNHKLAGENNPMWSKHHSEEAKEKIRTSKKNLSKESRQKISDSAKARQTEEYRQKQSNAHKGIRPSETTRRKMSESQKARWTDEKRAEWSKRFSGDNSPRYGKHMSDEQKEKLKQSHVGLMSGHKNPRCNPVYCVQLDELFWGAKLVKIKYNINDKGVGNCCRGKSQHAGKHPVTQEPLTWKFVYDQTQKDGTIIQGAITLGYVTEKDIKNYLNNLQEGE